MISLLATLIASAAVVFMLAVGGWFVWLLLGGIGLMVFRIFN